MPGAAVLNRGTFYDGRKPRLIRTKRKKEETVQQKIRILKRPGFRGIVSSFFQKFSGRSKPDGIYRTTNLLFCSPEKRL